MLARRTLRRPGRLARCGPPRPNKKSRWIYGAWPRREAAPTAPEAESERLRRLEAVLFMAREPLSSRKLARFADLEDGKQARSLVRTLNRQYDELGRAFRVEEVGGGFQLRTRAQFADWLRRLGHAGSPVRLSAPAMETLAVVAYRQPVLRAEVEAIRGVQCSEILKQLMALDLVRIAGRSDELGRPYLYGTTRRFLEVFGLRSLDQLPQVNIFREEEDHSRLPGPGQSEPDSGQPEQDSGQPEETEAR